MKARLLNEATEEENAVMRMRQLLRMWSLITMPMSNVVVHVALVNVKEAEGATTANNWENSPKMAK